MNPSGRTFRENLIRTLARLFCGHRVEIENLAEQWLETKPSSTKRITNQELRNLLSASFSCPLYLSDKGYTLPSYDDIAWFLAQDSTNRITYQSDSFDCDDFSYHLLGQFSVPGWSDLAFGIVWTDTHALNCVFDEELHFWFVEPQSDDIQSELKSWQGEKLQFIII